MTSFILPDHDGPGAVLVYLLATLGAVRPQVVAHSPAEWRRALAELQAVDIRIEEKQDGRVALVETSPEPGRLSEAERVRSLVRQSPSWVRAITMTLRWPTVLQRVKNADAHDSRAATETAPRPAYEMRFGMREASANAYAVAGQV
jgi:hypothetical protein